MHHHPFPINVHHLLLGNYPFPSTYITFSVVPGKPTALPAWPMREACERGGLNKDFGIKQEGDYANVRYSPRSDLP